jgi:hypothetical protein
MAAAPIAAPSGSYPVTGTPASVIIAVRLVVTGVVAHSYSSVDTHSFHRAGAQLRQGQGKSNSTESERHTSIAEDVHFGSVLLSLSVHSINPNGAPAGSATTATWPP